MAATRRIYRRPWRIDVVDSRVDGGRLPIAIVTLAGCVARALDAVNAPAPASIGLILSDVGESALDKVVLHYLRPFRI